MGNASFPHTPADLTPGAMFTREGHGTYWVTTAADALDNDHTSTSVETDQGIITLDNAERIHVHPSIPVPASYTPGQQPKSGLYRTVITVEVLHNGAEGTPDPAQMELSEIAEEGYNGAFSIATSADTTEVSPGAMADLLTGQGSDPSFLLSNQDVTCRECNGDITRVEGWFGVLNHADPDSLDGVDHDKDADHVPVPDVPEGYKFCENCMTAHPAGVEDACSPNYTH